MNFLFRFVVGAVTILAKATVGGVRCVPKRSRVGYGDPTSSLARASEGRGCFCRPALNGLAGGGLKSRILLLPKSVSPSEVGSWFRTWCVFHQAGSAYRALVVVNGLWSLLRVWQPRRAVHDGCRQERLWVRPNSPGEVDSRGVCVDRAAALSGQAGPLSTYRSELGFLTQEGACSWVSPAFF